MRETIIRHHIELDAGEWRTVEDVYSDLLAALKSVTWHGKNLDALWDSITEKAAYGGSSLIGIQPPFHRSFQRR